MKFQILNNLVQENYATVREISFADLRGKSVNSL